MIIPVVLTAIVLGGAFDMYQVERKSFQIFDSDSVSANIQVIPNHSFESKYIVPRTASEVTEFLDVDPYLALMARFGVVDFAAFHNYFRFSINREAKVEVLIKVAIQTETETFPPNVKQGTGWQERQQKYVGTHFIKSKLMGGHLFISYKLVPIKPENIEIIRSTISKAIGHAGEVNDAFFEKLNGAIRSLQGKFSQDVQSSLLPSLPVPMGSLDQIQRAVETFPETVKGFGDGKGTILRLELEDISTVDSRFLPFNINKALIPILKEANDMYDDINVATEELKKWDGYFDLNEEQQKLVGLFNKQLTKARRSLSSAIGNLNVTGSETQFAEAFAVYNRGEENVSYRYVKELQKLKG